MGKRIGIIAALCCVLALSLALVGCGESVDKSKYTGEWKLAYGTGENLDAEAVSLMESLGLTAKLTLNEDGTGTVSMFGSNESVTWDASSNTEGTIEYGGNKGSLKLNESELSIVDGAGQSMTFKRP